MFIYPAIDLMGMRAVRLKQGRREDVIDVGEPLSIAQSYVQSGARWLHLVDLDGAFDGSSNNRTIIHAIAQTVSIPVQLGGGIRTIADIRALIEAGISRIILGTVALHDPDLVATACARYPGQIACGIDARGGRVAVRGWVEQSDVDALSLAQQMKAAGVCCILYTDIAKDGMMQGPNLHTTAELINDSGLPVIASGGISTLDDIAAVRDLGAQGAIIGKALYQGVFTLEEALDMAQGTKKGE